MLGTTRGAATRWLAAAAVLTVAATSCFWAEPGYGPERTAFNPSEDAIGPDTAADLTEMWQAHTEDGAARFPIMSARGVHLVDNSHVYGFDGKTGELLWRYDAPAYTAVGPAIDIGQRLLVGVGPWGGTAGPPYSTVRIDTSTGAVVDASIADGWIVTMGELDYLVHRFNRPAEGLPLELTYEHVGHFDGTRNWSARTFVQMRGLKAPPPPTLGYFVYQAGQGGLLDAQGGPAGTGNALRGYSTMAPPSGPCTNSKTPVACPKWSTPLDGTTASSPVLAAKGEQVFTGTDAGTLYAVDGSPLDDIDPGVLLWSVGVGAGVSQSPALADGVLYVPTATGDLVAVEAASGAVLWRGATGSSIDVQPAVAGGVVFTGSADGALHAYDANGCGGAATCPPLWSLDTGDAPISGAPVVAQGQLLVGTADGRLLVYGLPA